MPTEQDYKAARALAIDTLARLDIDKCCAMTGLSVQGAGTHKRRIIIPYLGYKYCLIISDKNIAFENSDVSLKLPDQVLLLHYLITSSGVPVEDRWITFREVPSGPFYYPSFVKRAVTPLVRSIGQAPAIFKQVAQTIGQIVETPADIALKVIPLPRVPVVLSLWKGDEEFPPEGNVYFDASVSSYLPTEDIAYIAGAVVYKVLAIARGLN
ncbi:MAG: hypothetical protein DRH15_05615 [Deltaproteobacteria bacterium]|nr:MAG: hypothetical protein DRH15_05615 [Deltaproteobacteria bacterium]